MNPDRTWLATVLFMDIVSYSVTDVNQQLKVKLHFQDLVLNELNKLDETETIRLDTGDGMAICYLGDPEQIYPVARKLREKFAALKNGSDFNYEVRMGLNLGPIKIVEDLNHERNCLGSGINDAERVMSFAAGNQLLVSRSYYEIVSKVSQQYSNELNHVGQRADKHDQQHDLYELIVEVVRASDLSQTASIESPSHNDSDKFDSVVIDRISKELVNYIKRSDAEILMQQSMANCGSVYELCTLLLDSITSKDDRYSFDQYLKSYGYHGYEN
ncbi:MAG: hypothetical protein HOM14_03040 [Gammaproteobacteria bacterium]|jgi:class 3 adenylate cyclase|nr:hypothetical protein [Gammaproteobacteria bacterium]MBT3722932.1 hypothetical protein [Gammaproteobacteria bacterium]MBT4075877.1 hypothetical protein [Gammaproteobacteria bacterium]MBT4193410.1 hypothetical protein [Gammaproteobacteria bacterium]MBT4449049.1 hypothetical protein [Gammaproteobacteria bacterium]